MAIHGGGILTYDASKFTATMVDETIKGTYTLTVNGNEFNSSALPNAGENQKYKVTFTSEDETFKDVVVLDNTLNVGKREISIKWGDTEFIYNKTEQAPTATIDNVVGTDDADLTVTGGKTDVGTAYTATAALATGHTANYTLPTENTTTFKITKKPVTPTISKIADQTYTGEALKPTLEVKDGITTLTLGTDYTVAYSNNTNAGTATATATLEGNYTGSADKTFTIDKSDTSTTEGVVVKLSTQDNLTFTYGDTITVVYTPQMKAISEISMATKTAQLYYDETAIGNLATVDENGKYTMEYKTTDKDIPLGNVNGLTIKFGGDDNLNVATIPVNGVKLSAKEISAVWTDLLHTYDGTEKFPTATLLGVEGEDVVSVGSQVKTDSGNHEITAKLTGADSDNYILINPKCTLVIQKASVVFTVSNNIVKADDSAKTATVTSTPDTVSHEITYKDAKGEIVESPTEVGDYGIYAEITNDNYRHNTSAGGQALKIGILTIYETVVPKTYTVSFDGGDGATGSVTSLPAAQSQTVRIMPENGFTNSGNHFVGWEYEGKTFKTGTSMIQPSKDVVMTAIWAENAYSVDGIVENPDGVVENAVVTLMLGNTEITQDITDVNGAYQFTNVLPGRYNLVVTKDGIIKTELVVITDDDVAQNIKLPAGKSNSVVDVKPGTPDIIVGGLENEFTDEELTSVESGSTIERKLTIAKVETPTDKDKIDAVAENIGIYLDIDYLKTVTDTLVGTPTEESLTTATNLLQIEIPLDGGLQGKSAYQVHRIHGGDVQTLTTSANEDGEYIEINDDKTTITIYTKKFSTYAVAYSETAPDGGGSGGGSSTTYYDIKIVEGKNGTVSPDGDTSNIIRVRKNSDKTFTITPDEGYIVSDVLVDGKSVGAVSSYTFKDVKADHTIEAIFEISTIIELNKENHIDYIYGYEGGTFGLNQSITRAETVVMFSRLMMDKMEEGKTYTSTFTDITGDEWYANTVGYMEQFGIVTGFPDDSFGGDTPITRAEFVTIASKFDTFSKTGENIFSDVSDSYWATGYILSASSKGFITGYEDGTFKPTQSITRAEAVTVVNNMLNRTADQEYIREHKDDILTFNDVSNTHWAYFDILEASNGHKHSFENSVEVWINHK